MFIIVPLLCGLQILSLFPRTEEREHTARYFSTLRTNGIFESHDSRTGAIMRSLHTHPTVEGSMKEGLLHVVGKDILLSLLANRFGD